MLINFNVTEVHFRLVCVPTYHKIKDYNVSSLIFTFAVFTGLFYLKRVKVLTVCHLRSCGFRVVSNAYFLSRSGQLFIISYTFILFRIEKNLKPLTLVTLVERGHSHPL